MKREGLLKQSLRLAFSREVVLFALVCTVFTVVTNLLYEGGVFIASFLQLAFMVAFGMYIFNLSLAKALSKYFNKKDELIEEATKNNYSYL